ncbi:MAG TPA: isocitrate lyase/PEP mutase family protein [Tepidisphaeraceae bacterium]|jgi:2-methylisocitrate lyase-like PEP mutase family enzyme|nr:isocitrate lyase/PEP mutase family protein [Tepidisphaeraceae bacterium]
MQHVASERISWKKALKKESPLLLPVAHDALSARIIEQAGFAALQIGGFAVEGSRHGIPDINLTHFAERYAAVKDIMAATSLPIMVDADDGYGDAKNITYTVRAYQGLGIQALFIEDQQAPKECGHMDNKKVVPTEEMVNKIKAAVDAKSDREFFILARSDAINPEGLDSVLRRGEKYLKAGADGIYIEGPETVEQLQAIGKAFKGTPLATSILENGGKTPWLPPEQFGEMGFSMILYPTSILFRSTHAIQSAARDLRSGRPLEVEHAVDMKTFEKIVDLEHWRKIEKKFPTED